MQYRFVRYLVLIFLIAGSFSGNGQDLKITYANPYGINSITYRSQELLNIQGGIGRVMTAELFTFQDRNGQYKSYWSDLKKQEWDNANKTHISTYQWGKIKSIYKQIGDTLNINLEISNGLPPGEKLKGVSFCPFYLVFKARPSNFQPYYPYYSNNISSPAVTRAELENFSLIIENPDRDKKVYTGMVEENNSGGKIYKIWNGNIPFNGMNGFDNAVELNLESGKTFQYNLNLKFVRQSVELAQVASKAVNNFRLNKPSTISWKDRRPIGEIFLSSYKAPSGVGANRNWIFTNQAISSSMDGKSLSDFRMKVLAHGHQSLRILKSMNAQGVIVWDIEGQQYPHPVSYIGDPEMLPKLAPEMNLVADEYFKIFTSAGIKTGICIRPDSVVINGNWVEHLVAKNPLKIMQQKINYARKRWGCTIFYVDSNFDPEGRPMPVEIFKELGKLFPDILLIPEHETIEYYNYTAPFSDLKREDLFVEDQVKQVNPAAFKVISVAEGLKKSSSANLADLKKSVSQGNILLFRAWYNDEPTNGLIFQATKQINNGNK